MTSQRFGLRSVLGGVLIAGFVVAVPSGWVAATPVLEMPHGLSAEAALQLLRTPPGKPVLTLVGCCKTCSKGKACGDSCISRDKQCTKGAGCACDG